MQKMPLATKIDHTERPVVSLETILAECPCWIEELTECYALALQIADVKERLGSPIFAQAKNMLRKQRDELYKQFKAFDYDIRYEVYSAVPVGVREAIPYQTCWLHAYDPFAYP